MAGLLPFFIILPHTKPMKKFTEKYFAVSSRPLFFGFSSHVGGISSPADSIFVMILPSSSIIGEDASIIRAAASVIKSSAPIVEERAFAVEAVAAVVRASALIVEEIASTVQALAAVVAEHASIIQASASTIKLAVLTVKPANFGRTPHFSTEITQNSQFKT